MKKKRSLQSLEKLHKLLKKEKEKEQSKYKIYCKLRYYVILFAYVFQYLVTLLLCCLTIPWDFVIFNIHFPVKLLSICAMTTYLIAKWYLLKNTKFRKKGFYSK